MGAVFFQTVITMEVANSREMFTKLHGIHIKIWGYMRPNISASFENEKVASAE